MPNLHPFWSALPELESLASFASRLQSPIGIRGSVARRLFAAERAAPFPSSLLDFVPPFADINLTTQRPGDAHALRSLIATDLAYAGFFKWDITTEQEREARLQSADVIVHREPWIEITTKMEAFKSRATVQVWKDAEGLEVIALPHDQRPSPDFEASPRLRADFDPDHLAPSIRQLLFLLREYPDEKNRTHELAAWIAGPPTAAHDLAKLWASPETGEELLVALARLCLADRVRRSNGDAAPRLGDEARQLPGGPLQILGAPFIGLLQNELTGEARKVFALCGTTSAMSAPVFVRQPEQERGAWVPKLAAVTSATQVAANESGVRAAAAGLDWSGRDGKQIVSPPVAIQLPPPPSPGCCRYQDFTRGLLEIAWAQGAPPAPPLNSHLVGLGDPANPTEAIGQAHAYVAIGPTGSVRADYNFMSILAGAARKVTVIAAATEGI